jgi:hypothetical protein
VVQESVISPNPAVSLLDQYQNPVSANVTVVLVGGNFTASTTTVSAINGVAAFSNLKVATIGNFTMTFNATGITPLSATSNQFSVVSPVASGLDIRSIAAAGGGNYTISFTAAQGGNYWVQRKTDLKVPGWSYVGANASTAITGNNTTTVATPGGTKAFWRLTTQAPPP